MNSSASIHRTYITGGSGGIGFAVAKEALLRGSDVLLIARNPGRLAAAAEALRSIRIRREQRISVLALDIADRDALRTGIAGVLRDFGDPDLLVNCAGDACPGYFEEIPDEKFEEMINVHVKGLWYVTRTLAEPLKRRRGAIVNVSSLAGLVGVFGYTAYSAAKFAVIGFSEALRSEMKPCGVHVAVLCPPDTDTPQLARENETKPKETRAIAANTRVLSPEQVARALYAGLDKKIFLIIPGLPARFAARIIRYFPGIMRRFMDRTITKVRESKEPGDMRSL